MRKSILAMLLAGMSANAPAADERKELPSCPGAYDHATWTNCTGDVTLPSGHTYTGEFRDGRYSGQGTFTTPDGQIYVGEYKDGKPSGRGTHRFRGGEKYVGEFSEGRYNGHGAFTFPDGRKYVGEYKDGKPNGQGIEYRPNGTVQRTGVWENGVFNGR
ncbi:MAG: hypothetical protein HY017_08245 [Betaproteobacteria bacterium]|nr:hypothetical protein [Betaproteobacteria bacterium]